MTEETDRHKTLQAIYKERLLQLFREPLGTGEPDPGAFRGWAKNRTCGDEVAFYSQTNQEGIITHCWQNTAGCAIATATSSLLVQALAGKSREEYRQTIQRIRALVYEGHDDGISEELKLLSAVHELRSRHDCVGVSLDAASKALEDHE